MNVDRQVRDWLMRERPGLIEAASPQEAFRKAWAASGIQCAASEFKDALARAGFLVDVVQNRYRLALPARAVGE